MPRSVLKGARRRAMQLTATIATAVAIVVAGAYWFGTTQPPSQPATKAAATAISHIVLIMEENHASTATIGHMPYLDSLRTQYASLTNYYATNYPSLPNYMMLSSGIAVPPLDCSPGSAKKAGIESDDRVGSTPKIRAAELAKSTGNCTSPNDNIFHQLGSNWRVLAESMPKPCTKPTSGEYATRHTMAPYFTDIPAATCIAQDIPYSESTVPNISAAFTVIAPNLINDGHTPAGISKPDAWLKVVVPKILSSAQYATGNTLVEITWDSGSNNCGANCQSHVETVLVNPQLSALTVATKATHASLLRLNEELLGLPLLGAATSAPDIRVALGL
jgi:hypothetical protein